MNSVAFRLAERGMVRKFAFIRCAFSFYHFFRAIFDLTEITLKCVSKYLSICNLFSGIMSGINYFSTRASVEYLSPLAKQSKLFLTASLNLPQSPHVTLAIFLLFVFSQLYLPCYTIMLRQKNSGGPKGVC
jgi:hypothetical protein